jgi:transcriptional regulator with XRE-family HTH domain
MPPPQLAAESSLQWNYIGQVERGQRNVTLHNILKLAEVLGVDPGDLVRGLRAGRRSAVRAR